MVSVTICNRQHFCALQTSVLQFQFSEEIRDKLDLKIGQLEDVFSL